MTSKKNTTPRHWALRVLIRLTWTAAILLALAAAAWGTHQLTPKPLTWLVARVLDQMAAQTSAALAKHRPDSVRVDREVVYRQTPTALAMDIYRPTGKRSAVAPTVVWIHGGGWVAGRKEDVGHYAHVLAGRGFNVVAVEYTLATDKPYPTQLMDVNQALGFILQQGDRLQLDRRRIFLAGDSAGAQLAAQLAAATTDADYARRIGIRPALQSNQIAGVALFGGPFDLEALRLDGPMGPALRAVLWTFLGNKDFRQTTGWEQASVLRHVGRKFPPTFITAGNDDPLLTQSLALRDRLKELSVPVQDLFFAPDHQPPLPHEYQFNLDQQEGRQALEGLVTFLQARSR